MGFFKDFIESMLDEGHTVEIATNESRSKVPDCYRKWGCKVYQIGTSRSLLNKGNIMAVWQIKKIVQDNHYEIVHCHTPIAAVCTRLACRKVRKWGTQVFYTAHGFHFYQGAPLKNWLLYYPVEWLCAHWTDVLITINKEDYVLAQKKMKAGKVEYVPGVGIDLKKFGTKQTDVSEKRKEFGIGQDAILLLSVGELSKRKNHELVIRTIKEMNNPSIKYYICGTGQLSGYFENLIKELSLEEQVFLLGYKSNIIDFLRIADLFVFPSLQEGLPVALMEAMASGLPCVASDIRGNRDLIKHNVNGFLFDLNSRNVRRELADYIIKIIEDKELKKRFESNAVETMKKYDLRNVERIMQEIYTSL